MDVFGKAGPSLVHTTCTKGIYVDSGTHHMFQKKGPTYKERMNTQQETLAFCYKYGATLEDMSAPFPNPLGMNPDGVRNTAVFHGHGPLGMTLINGHLKAAVYLLTIGASGRAEHLLEDEAKWMQCLLHERTKEEETALHDQYHASTAPMNMNMPMNGFDMTQQMQAGMNQLRALGERYSCHKTKGTFSVPQDTKKVVLTFAKNVVDAHQEYHTFLLCTRRASVLVPKQKRHVLEPLGRVAFLHIRQMVKECLIIPDVSKDNLQKCYQVCLRMTKRFGLRCGECGASKMRKVLKCCTVVYCSKDW